MIGALPGLNDGLFPGRLAVLGDIPEPFPALPAVPYPGEDKIPLVPGGLQVFIAHAVPPGVEASQNRFCLHPPDALFVRLSPFLFVGGALPGHKGLPDHRPDQALELRAHAGGHPFVPQDVQGMVQEPAGLDIVAVACQVDQRLIVRAEEDLLPGKRRVVHVPFPDVQLLQEAFAHPFVPRGPVQFGIALGDMQQGVHGPGGADAVFGKLFVAFRREILFEGLKVPFFVPAAVLNDVKQFKGLLQRFPAAAGHGIG